MQSLIDRSAIYGIFCTSINCSAIATKNVIFTLFAASSLTVCIADGERYYVTSLWCRILESKSWFATKYYSVAML